MAEVLTTETINATVAPFSVMGRRENTSIPWGVCSFVSQFTAPQVAAGDTGKVVIDFMLPQNYWFELAGFHIDMAATSAPTWTDGVLRSFYTGANALNPGFTQQEIFFPLAVTSEASIGTTQHKNVGVSSGGSQSAYDVNSPVKYLQTTPDSTLTATKPQVQLYSVANAHATVFRVAVIYKMFDINQANHPWLSAK
tara:strand:- start:485 stop:1072 length:588 start_codon:yes stop_codon:yes gene_type:complete